MVETHGNAILTTAEVLAHLLSHRTRDQLARLMHVDPSYVSHLRAGRRRLGFENAQVLADLAECELSVRAGEWMFAVRNGPRGPCVSRKSRTRKRGEK